MDPTPRMGSVRRAAAPATRCLRRSICSCRSDEIDEPLAPRVEQALGWARGEAGELRVLRRSLDARKGRPLGQRLRVLAARKGETLPTRAGARAAAGAPLWPAGRPAPRVVVVGSGPGGIVGGAAAGRGGRAGHHRRAGQAVQPRRHDLALLTRGELTPSSNYCFGEGGAGTFSDGKLYTRAKDRDGVRRGHRRSGRASARPPRSRVEARPHVGSNRLPQRAHGAARRTWRALGVEYRFERRVAGLLRARRATCSRRALAGATSSPPTRWCWRSATRRAPVYEWAARRRRRARAQGVRGRRAHRASAAARSTSSSTARAAGHPRLPAAFYELTRRSAGGSRRLQLLHVPGRLDRPGGDRARRRRRQRHEPVAPRLAVRELGRGGHRRRRRLRSRGGRAPRRHRAAARGSSARRSAAGGGRFRAPAQRAGGLPRRARRAATVGSSSYRPGLAPGDLRTVLPPFVAEALRAGLRAHGGARCRGSCCPRPCWSASRPAPARRSASCATRTTLRVAVDGGLYPCGEGAGYAGGIVSAALDGVRVAERDPRPAAASRASSRAAQLAST